MKNKIIQVVLCLIFSLTTLSLPAEEQETQLQNLWTFHWELDETVEGQESAMPVEPVEVTFLNEPVEIASHSASLALLRKYSVHLGPEWSPGLAYRLLQTFESIPQHINNLHADAPSVDASLWRLSDQSSVYFTDSENDESPVTIEVQTTNPDSLPPVLDVNRITIEASPTHPEAPNGETQVGITFRVKDDISGYAHADMYLRDPQGNIFFFGHSDKEWDSIYFSRDPTVYETYHKTIILPVGSAPGVWGLAEMSVRDKANNWQQYDFTEIVRFEVGEVAAAPIIASLPKDTQLLANYPNPFNPETWIPYQLAVPGDVTFTIYSMNGSMIRRLAFGHQSAGVYQSRSRAAYWDGRNTVGEPVASGLYFYTLTTGDFTATRKLLIRK